MTGYTSRVGKGEYKIIFETDNKENYHMIEEIIRMMIDREYMNRLRREWEETHDE